VQVGASLPCDIQGYNISSNLSSAQQAEYEVLFHSVNMDLEYAPHSRDE